ncbi:MAG: hypothetical protein HOH95_10390 [Dehalococcoidia bacterium]|nr:hypothetical protein [Dehalococcoidia bacterium]
MFDFEDDMSGSVLQVIGIAYLVITLAGFSADKGQLDLAVIVDVAIAPLGLLVFAFIIVPYIRRRPR